MPRVLQIISVIATTVAVSFADESLPKMVEQSQRETSSELLFEIPADAFDSAFARFGKPDGCDLKLAYHCFVANDGYVQLAGAYSRTGNNAFDVKVQNRNVSTGSNSSMIYGEIVFGKVNSFKLPFVIAVAKTGVMDNGHDKIEGHVVWLKTTE
jgi:hypothetical protein